METKKHLDNAWNLLSTIPVSGDWVDVMFVAREELRKAYQELKEDEDGG